MEINSSRSSSRHTSSRSTPFSMEKEQFLDCNGYGTLGQWCDFSCVHDLTLRKVYEAGEGGISKWFQDHDLLQDEKWCKCGLKMRLVTTNNIAFERKDEPNAIKWFCASRICRAVEPIHVGWLKGGRLTESRILVFGYLIMEGLNLGAISKELDIDFSTAFNCNNYAGEVADWYRQRDFIVNKGPYHSCQYDKAEPSKRKSRQRFWMVKRPKENTIASGTKQFSRFLEKCQAIEAHPLQEWFCALRDCDLY